MTMPDEETAERAAHVVLIHRYFYPDTPPYASILKQIAEELANDGIRVSVLTCQPSYNRTVIRSAPPREELGPNVSVIRWPVIDDRKSTWAKGINLLVFGARVAFKLGRMKRVDAVMAASTPPVLLALVASLVARAKNVPFIYHKQDVYPEVTDSSDGLSLVKSLLRAVDAGTDRRASMVVVLSGDMAQTVGDRGADPAEITVINNFDPWPATNEHAGEAAEEVDKVRFVYAGNLGRFQNLEVLARAIERHKSNPGVTFDFVGDGPMKSWMQRFVDSRGLGNVRLHGYVEPTALARMMQESFDVGLVSLKPGVIRCAYPSKTMSYLRNSLPVLALVEPSSELSDMLTQYAAGWAADPSDPLCIDSAIQAVLDNREELHAMRKASRRMYEQEFGRERQLMRWRAVFDKVMGIRS